MPPDVTTEATDEIMEVVMGPPEAEAPEALTTLGVRLREGVSASPLAVAILGWLCDVDTDPYVVVIRLQGNQVVMRLSDEKITAPFGPLPDFLGQIAVLCDALGLAEAQTQDVTDTARQRLGRS